MAARMDTGREAGGDVERDDVGLLEDCTTDEACDDGLFCNGGERCLAGSCAPAEAPVNCDDGISCTADRCDDTARACAFTPTDTACSLSPGGRCDPELGCQYPSCTTETCVADPCQTAVCEDDVCMRTNACTGAQMCCAGSCVAAGCSDGNSCTTDSCGMGGCIHIDNTEPCNDGNACTTSSTCSGGACVGSGSLSCADRNVCTTDSCNPMSGCVYTNNTGPCDDGDPCTVRDSCGGGACSAGLRYLCGSRDCECDGRGGCISTRPGVLCEF